MEFRVLGPLELEADGRDVAPGRPRERSVLGALLLRRGRTVSIDMLVDAIWGSDPPPTARTALHGHISALRRRLGAERILTEPGGYRLHLSAGDSVDVDRLTDALGAAAAAMPAVRSEALREALELFRGEPYEGLALDADPDAELAAEARAEAGRVAQLRLTAEEQRAAADLELGREAEVAPRLEILVARHPLRESLRTLLMLALYRTGRQADALAVAQDARRVLADELGVDPGPALLDLERRVLEHDPALLRGVASGEPVAGAGSPAIGLLTFLATDAPAEVLGEAADAADGWSTAAFDRARDAAGAAIAILRQTRTRPARVGLHSATVDPVRGLAAGPERSRARHIAALAHPGQALLSEATRDLLREAPAAEVDVLGRGAHRLADLAAAVPLSQLVAPGLAVDFPPPRGLEARPTNLPVQHGQLIGREPELRDLASLLREPDVRLVTLTGPGGTGKTRLALHAAAECVDAMPGGVYVVQLDAVAEPGLVGSAIAESLGTQPDGGEAIEGALARQLRVAPVLLVLDNFEHLLAAARVVADLLDGVPELTVLATSRRALGLERERVVPVPPLSVTSDAREASAADAVTLYASRARSVSPGFSVTADNAAALGQLVQAVDGLPLAIELAASRIAVAPPALALERIRHSLRVLASPRRAGPARHRALEATIEWSHDLLDPPAQELFADLAVFAGGWTLAAAELVCGAAVDTIDRLANLADHSLVRVGGSEEAPRFAMLETIREFASSRLDATGRRREVEGRHAELFTRLAEEAAPHLRGNPGPWLDRLAAERGNLRAALDRLAAVGDGHGEAALAGALWRFWYLAGDLAEGRRRLEAAVASHDEPTPARARVLIGAAVMAVNSEDHVAAEERAGEALVLHEALGDDWGAAYARFMLAAAARLAGDDGRARDLGRAALDAFRRMGDEHSALLAGRNLAATLEALGDRDAARMLYQDNLRRARADANGRLEASSLGALSSIAFDEGRLTDAVLMLRESLRLHRGLGDRLDTAVDLARAARTLSMTGLPAESARLVAALARTTGELGLRRRTVESMTADALARSRRQLAPAELEEASRAGSRLDLSDALDLALQALG